MKLCFPRSKTANSANTVHGKSDGGLARGDCSQQNRPLPSSYRSLRCLDQNLANQRVQANKAFWYQTLVPTPAPDRAATADDNTQALKEAELS